MVSDSFSIVISSRDHTRLWRTVEGCGQCARPVGNNKRYGSIDEKLTRLVSHSHLEGLAQKCSGVANLVVPSGYLDYRRGAVEVIPRIGASEKFLEIGDAIAIKIASANLIQIPEVL
jgi:hypothetical protein